ncbi:hypothetical protein SARC_07391 [Sphaeroforma arctica JP610]|uniref:Uncharacterized protein n=1 Tax=Sphaeroforma arctica JP610 TaxID=667725 RepID=A0A0L0FWC5_9EUKA|nr:hypothetical protein SARC_07391 [Sphaeroforma arctica JP610]KNC80253.1 hypothetical protein SARC_07391 [Sphaeroforma arctica JP610]|eukprot:XP_014154155.1 hypothetical protein SARC_07391 [Sphaeroforma arctica JP610]
MPDSIQNLHFIPRDVLLPLWRDTPEFLDGATVRPYVKTTNEDPTSVVSEAPDKCRLRRKVIAASKFVLESTSYTDAFYINDKATTLKLKNGVEHIVTSSGTGTIDFAQTLARDVTVETAKYKNAPLGLFLTCSMRIRNDPTRYIGTTKKGGAFFSNSDKSAGYVRYHVYIEVINLSDEVMVNLVNNNPHFQLQCCRGTIPDSSACAIQNVTYDKVACMPHMSKYCTDTGFEGCKRWARANATETRRIVKDWCAKPTNKSKMVCACYDQVRIDKFLADTRRDFPNTNPSENMYMCRSDECDKSGQSIVALAGRKCADTIIQSCTMNIDDGAEIGRNVDQFAVLSH